MRTAKHRVDTPPVVHCMISAPPECPTPTVRDTGLPLSSASSRFATSARSRAIGTSSARLSDCPTKGPSRAVGGESAVAAQPAQVRGEERVRAVAGQRGIGDVEAFELVDVAGFIR
jgi:hypothetical protein